LNESLQTQSQPINVEMETLNNQMSKGETMTPANIPPPDDWEPPTLFVETENDFIEIYDWFVHQNLLDRQVIVFDDKFVFETTNDCAFYTAHLTKIGILNGYYHIPTNVFAQINGYTKEE